MCEQAAPSLNVDETKSHLLYTTVREYTSIFFQNQSSLFRNLQITIMDTTIATVIAMSSNIVGTS